MKFQHRYQLNFEKRNMGACFVGPSGNAVEKKIEIRTNPITFRTCRIALSRMGEEEAGTGTLPPPPPDAFKTDNCPFCHNHVFSKTPQLLSDKFSSDRLVINGSILFPNLFPYGSYSAVSLFDNAHYVQIGSATPSTYKDSFKNSIQYLKQVLKFDQEAIYMAITQNHLPSAGGSLIHPHLQINADRTPTNHQRYLLERSLKYSKDNGAYILSDYLAHEKTEGSRYIGHSGDWEWVSAFAPEGFFELWGILPGMTSFRTLHDKHLMDLSMGIINAQKFYRNLNRNGYNLGILCIEDSTSRLELRVVMIVRSNYAPWVRNDHTGFEVMLGDMATFITPEETAKMARPFWALNQD